MYGSMDNDSTLLAIQLQMDDLKELDASREDNTQRDEILDAETSLRLHATELERLKRIIIDQTMAQSLTPHSHSENAEGDASSPVRGKKRPRTIMLECEACREDKDSTDVCRLPCGQVYCNDCLQRLFEASMTDESLFPPRCCRQPIPIELVKTSLTTNIVERFNIRKVEIETPNRTYCSSRQCSSFVHPNNIIADIATCQQCGTVTCAICKAKSHAGDCPSDPAIQNLQRLSSEKGWQKCYNCNRIVELTIGCNHVTCYCRAEFCYKCAKKWQTCSCPLWDEENLLFRAAEIVDQNNAGNIDPQERAQRIAAAVGLLRDDPHCAHDAWDQVNGPHQCAWCSCRMFKFTFECRQCGVRFCQECRRNRF